jgi:hypothetical protein
MNVKMNMDYKFACMPPPHLPNTHTQKETLQQQQYFSSAIMVHE